MKRSRWGLAVSCAGLVAFAVASLTSAADKSTLPVLESLAGETFTTSERAAIIDWTLSQPEVRARTDGRRYRLLRAASESAKTASGDARRAILYVRNYDAGVVHAISVDLASARIEIRDLRHAAASPSAEEIQAAMTLVKADPAFEAQAANPMMELMGGFQWTGEGAADPCARDFCVQLAFMEQNFEKKPVHFIIVDLSRQEIVNRDLVKNATTQAPSNRREGD